MKKILSLSVLGLTMPFASVAAESEQNSVSLSPLLMYVADRNSADMIAPKVQTLIDKTPIENIVLDEFDRTLLDATGCFGSESLSRALSPLIQPVPAEEMPEIAQHMALLHEMWNIFDQLTLAISAVNCAEDAESAALLLDSFKPFMYSWSQAVSRLPEPEGLQAKRRLRMEYMVQTRPRIGKLLNAWGDLALRDAEYYGSAHLVEGLQGVCEVLENMDMAADPDAMPALATTARKLIPLLNQWLGVISLVRDKDSADAAAPHIIRLHLQMKELMREAELSRVHERDLFHVSPRFEIQAHICDRIMHYLLDEVSPPCYGSAKLKAALQHED